jgi:ribosomal protein L37AE/L43A
MTGGPVDVGAGERATPFYCPYCGDEDLRPHGEKGGSWHCRGCARVFTLKFVGLEVA